MNTNGDKLALRRQSVRTLTADEMQIAHGGQNDTTTNNTRSGTNTTCTRTTQKPPTVGKFD
jgi:hypothetical protein